jgi:plastocyanin
MAMQGRAATEREVGRPVGAVRFAVPLLAAIAAALALAAPAGAGEKLRPASYPGMTTYSCRTDPIPIYPGQNTNLFATTKTCPNAEKVSGPGDASVFAPGSTAEGFITRFKPSMVEIKPKGKLVTPSVWDLHLHHVVWVSPNGGPTVASGEEKTTIMLPQGYGNQVRGDATWGLNYMIHSLNASGGRQVYVTWKIDWVPQTSPPRTDINPVRIRWLDVAGRPQLYPVFDAERGFDVDGDGKYVFPDEVPTDPAAPGYEERRKISPSHSWTVPDGGVNLVSGAGHLHPGGLHVDLQVARDGPDAGEIDGDDPGEVRELFRSDARYYEPAGAVSWDVSMEATRPDWRISLEGGDTVSIDVTYDVKRASWYESMGILPLAVSTVHDAAAKDPFDDAAAVQAMYDTGGILTHGRLPENVDAKARRNLKLSDPRELRSKGRRVPRGGIEIENFNYSVGGFSAFRDFPARLMRPPAVKPGQSVLFTNLDALSLMPDNEQVWHSITSCKAPCNRGSGIGYPLARGPIKFDSGQLGFGTGTSSEVTTGSNTYTTPPLTKRGKTYTYFCRIHPFMRGSIRVKGERPKRPNGSARLAEPG